MTIINNCLTKKQFKFNFNKLKNNNKNNQKRD